MLWCYIRNGHFESRKGLIYGPFCPVYGIGATLLIIILNSFYNNNSFSEYYSNEYTIQSRPEKGTAPYTLEKVTALPNDIGRLKKMKF